MVKVGSKRNSALEANLRAGLLRAQVWGELRSLCSKLPLHCFDWTGGQTCHWTHAGGGEFFDLHTQHARGEQLSVFGISQYTKRQLCTLTGD